MGNRATLANLASNVSTLERAYKTLMYSDVMVLDTDAPNYAELSKARDELYEAIVSIKSNITALSNVDQ